MKPESHIYTTSVGGREFTFETGKIAQQAGGAVTVRLGETMIFAAATMGDTPREGQDFFPLSVEYEERMYAGGIIPGSFFRREGRPGTDAILTARLTDRPLRPLFDNSMRNEVQILIYSWSADRENPLDILAINAASAALMISDIPWDGPIGAVRVGRLDGKFIICPTFEQIEASDLDLRIAGTSEAILMVECGAKEISEEIMVEALMFGQDALQSLIQLQKKMAAEIGKAKREVPLFATDKALVSNIYDHYKSEMETIMDNAANKAELNSGIDRLKEKAVADLTVENEDQKPSVVQAFDEAYKKSVRDRILTKNLRPDGRTLDQIRDIWCEVGISPRAHGSGLFTRGETQVLTLVTLGSPREAQEIDTLSPVDTKRYMHHYNFPPFSTGEVKNVRTSSRREIGHGALAERALEPVIPPASEFPYAMRLVSEVLSSNGSTSMASVCGSTLALMDTGVPIKAPVAGIAMGLIKEGDNYAILTDIQGLEDHLGDMDFKVAGTSKGITALQMDMKILGTTAELLSKALDKAKIARLQILEKMLDIIPVPSPTLKTHAPRITTVHIPIEKIGALIGPGGKNIRSLQEMTSARIDIEEDGTVFITANNGESETMAREQILMLTESAQLGRIYTGKVVRTTDFGAFVEILPNIDGLVHISQLDSERVASVEDVVQLGDEISVMVTNIDSDGKIRLSRQAVLEGWTLEEAVSQDKGGRSGGGNRSDRNSSRHSGSGGGRSGGNQNRNRRN